MELFNKEFSRGEFDRKVQENPLNDHLRVTVLPAAEKANSDENITHSDTETEQKTDYEDAILVLVLGIIIVIPAFIVSAFLTSIISKPLLATALEGNVIAAIQVSFFIVATFLNSWLITEVLRKITHKILN